MLIISQLRVPCGSGTGMLKKKAAKALHRKDTDFALAITRHSIDARHKPELLDVYSVSIYLPGGREEEERLAKKLHDRNISYKEEVTWTLHRAGSGGEILKNRPVVVGAGPAGLFAALVLAMAGLRPILIERGKPVEERTKDVEHFWKSGELNENSNIQFGEGGAGTYSDGKLTTNAKDKEGRTQFILNTFIETGADPSIAYEFLPHIGTDVLRTCVTSIRNRILSLGGTVLFETLVTGFENKNGKLTGVRILDEAAGKEQVLPCEAAVLAPGHSARDLVRTLYADGIPMEPKAFAVGLRVSHPQTLVNENQYGIPDEKTLQSLHLPAVSYKLTARAASGRGVYSFCMCPGGYIVDASSEPGGLAVNGMSDYARDSARANSAIVMTVGAETVGGDGPLDGLHFQERLERRAASLAAGRIPVERFTEFERAFRDPFSADTEVRPLTAEETEALCLKGRSARAPLHALLPETLTADFIEGMHTFERKIPGFAGPEALVAGLESRTSSSVRITRDESFQSNIRGLYPCGEGAGYAGGIMSAAIDGIRTAEAVARRYRPDAGTDEANGPQ